MALAQQKVEHAGQGQQFEYDGTLFPHIILNEGKAESMDECMAWLERNRAGIGKSLAETGAVLFRGFHVHTPEDFDRFIEAFGYENFAYKESLSNAVRTNITERVFTANEAPPEVDIFLHHELAQTPFYPGKLFFYCDIAPEEGGATPLCRSDILMDEITKALPETAKAFEEKGLRYTNIFPGDNDAASGQGRSWRSLLNCESREDAERRLEELGYSWEWQDNNCLKITSPVLPAVMKAENGKKVFFNQLVAAFRGWKDTRNDPSKAVTFGDGSPIPVEDMQVIIGISDRLSYDTNWQKGDVALIDNYLVMHGRRHFSGKRRVLASLVS